MFDQMTYNFPALLARVAQQKVHTWTIPQERAEKNSSSREMSFELHQRRVSS